MYSLFNNMDWGNRGGTPTYRNYRHVINGLKNNLERIVHYNRIYPVAVKPNHFLVKLIQSLNIPVSMDPQRMVDFMGERAEGVGMAMNITSPLHKGRIFHPGVFYGQGSQEILIIDSTPFNASDNMDNWESLRPVEFLYHPKSDLGMDTPMGFQTTSESGLSVIRINVPMLAFQYQQWRIREWMFNSENQRTITQFISSHPLNNLLYSQIDWALINRAVNTYNNKPSTNSTIRKSFTVTDYTDRVQIAMDQMTYDYRTRKYTMEQLLGSLDLVGVENALLRVALPKMLVTQQVKWALMLCREPITRFLVDWNIETGNNKNRTQLNTILLETRRFLNDNTLRGSVNKVSFEYWNRKLNELVDLTK